MAQRSYLISKETNDDTTLKYGYLVFNDGCKVKKLARFRLDVISGEIELQISENAGYASVYDWIDLKKSVS